MRLALCRLCENADRLASSGNPILIGLFNRMICQEFPAHLDPCSLAIEIETDPSESGSEVDLQVRLIDEDGHLLSGWSATFAVGEGRPASTLRTFESISLPWDNRFVFESPGTYRFDVVIVKPDGSEEILGGETLAISAAASSP